jgi:SRSO17 transposase
MEDGTLPQSHEATERLLATTTDATASRREGGRADGADIARRLAPSVARAASRHRVMGSRRGLLREAARQHRGHVAEACGAPTPSGVQDVLARADGEADLVREAVRSALLQHVGAPHGVLVRDATGVVNQGRHSAGGARQDTGTVGPGEHGPSGVLLGEARPLGQAWRDRERYRPQAWTAARERGQQAGIPRARGVATTPELARPLRARAGAAGGPATGVTGDRGEGTHRRRRRWLAGRPPPAVLAVSGQASVGVDGRPPSVKTRLAARPAAGWRRRRAGEGTQGPRGEDWRWPPLLPPEEPGWCRGLVVRRRVRAPDLTADGVLARQATTLEAVVRGAGSRWTSASGGEAATGAVGLEHDAVRRWTGW